MIELSTNSNHMTLKRVLSIHANSIEVIGISQLSGLHVLLLSISDNPIVYPGPNYQTIFCNNFRV